MTPEQDYRILRFRCAQTGKRFIVVFGRESDLLRFQIKHILEEQGNAKDSPFTEQPIAFLTGTVQKALSPLPDLVNEGKRFLQRLVGSEEQQEQSERTRTEPPRPSQPKYRPGSGSYDINEFDFAGWYCPCCGHGKDMQGEYIQFIKCGTCRELVCGSRVTRLPDGRRNFKCHDGCRGGGILGDGTMESVSGLNVDTNKTPYLPKRPPANELPDKRRSDRDTPALPPPPNRKR